MPNTTTVQESSKRNRPAETEETPAVGLVEQEGKPQAEMPVLGSTTAKSEGEHATRKHFSLYYLLKEE